MGPSPPFPLPEASLDALAFLLPFRRFGAVSFDGTFIEFRSFRLATAAETKSRSWPLMLAAAAAALSKETAAAVEELEAEAELDLGGETEASSS